MYSFSSPSSAPPLSLSLHDALPISRIQVREVSLVPFPAYQDAAVTAVRTATTNEKEPTMEPATTADVDAIREGLDEIGRARLNSSHVAISYAVFCLKKKKNYTHNTQ